MANLENNCSDIIKNIDTNNIVLNSDGTVSIFTNHPTLGLYPVQLTLECCKTLPLKDSVSEYFFDIDIQKCKWSNIPITCGFSEPINLVINPKGNDGTLFFIDDSENETCGLEISFDYLIKIKCETLNNITNPTITTNYVTSETTAQINTSQQTIESLTSEIETKTNAIISLNTQIANTPYSIYCEQFPIVTPDPVDCVVGYNGVVGDWSAWSPCVNSSQTRTRQVLIEPRDGGASCPVLSETQSCIETLDCVVGDWSAWSTCSNSLQTRTRKVLRQPQGSGAACPALTETQSCVNPLPCTTFMYKPFPNANTLTFKDCNGNPISQTFQPVGLGLYHSFCALGYKSDINKVRSGDYFESKAGCFSNMIGGLPLVPNFGNTIGNRISAFDNTGFVSKTIDNTLVNASVYKAAGTSYKSVNYCLTEDGLNVWKKILDSTGGTRYNAFIDGTKDESEASFTCADVVKLVEAQNDINNTKVLFVECTTPFWTKNNLINQLNILMSQLTQLNKQLTDEENKLIELNTIITTGTTSNTSCATPKDALETIELEMHLDYIDDKKTKIAFSAVTFPAINTIINETTNESINLYDYLALSGDSGFYICGDPSNTDTGLSACTTLSLNNGIEETPNVTSCSALLNNLFEGIDTKNLSNNALASNWLTYTTVINDPEIIKLITNKIIKLSIKVNSSCVDFCVLLDNIVLDKSCITSNRNDVIISKNPGFDLKRIVDNKKSWTDVNTQTNRNFIIAKSNGDSPFRQTNYDLNDERLIINSKEIDLDVTIASAIETDVWFYLNDNYNILNSIRYCSPCDDATKLFQDTEPVNFMNDFEYVFQDGGENNNYVVCCGDKSVDFTKLINIDLSTINNVNDFDAFMLSELIDAKNRQTISGYPTLRAIYDRYINSTKYVNTKSSAFDYITMDNFSKLIGSYWVDIIEQVVPSTSIWGSVKIYTNTIFDEQKFKYKEYTSIFCNKTKDCDTLYVGLSETNHIESVNTNDTIIEVVVSLVNQSDTTLKGKTKPDYFDNVFLSQMNVGSEFLGKVLITKK